MFLMEDEDLDAVIEATVDDMPSPIVGEHVMRIVNKAIAAERADIRQGLLQALDGRIRFSQVDDFARSLIDEVLPEEE